MTKPNHPPDQTQNYNSTWAFLKILPSGRDLGSFPQKSRMKLTKKQGMVPKKVGKKINFPPKLICVLDAKFNVDCDYAIKLDLAQCYNEVMDVQS